MISEFPLFIFTLLGGAGAGSYLFLAIFPSKKKAKPWQAPLIVILLLAISGLALLTHLGHPERMFLAFSNPTAGITIEGYAMIGFGVMVAIDLLMSIVCKRSNKTVKVITAIFGLLLLLAMAYAYASFLAIPVWATWQTYGVFVIGGLAMGSLLSALYVEGGFSERALLATTMVLQVLMAATLVLEGAVFASEGYTMIPFVLGSILEIASAAIVFIGRKGASWAIPLSLALSVIGIAIARYAFYSVL